MYLISVVSASKIYHYEPCARHLLMDELTPHSTARRLALATTVHTNRCTSTAKLFLTFRIQHFLSVKK